MSYAVVRINTKQYLVKPGQELIVDRIEGKAKAKLDFNEVLLTMDEKTVVVGQPLVKGAKVQAEIVDQVKGKKIRVAKFKAKSRYRKVTGHRQHQTRLKIVKI